MDITQQKLAQHTPKTGEEHLKLMIDQTPIVIWMTDSNGLCTYVNKKWCELTGRTDDEGLRYGWIDFVHPDDKRTIEQEWKKVFSRKEPLDIKFRYLNAQQTYIVVQCLGNARYDITGAFVGYNCILHDVTLQEHATLMLEREIKKNSEDLTRRNEELRRSDERYHLMIDEVSDYAIILLSRDGIIENWNKGAEQIKGYSASEAVGKSFKIFYTLEDQQQNLPEKLIEEARTNGKALHEGWRVRKDGSTFWGNTVITALRDENRNVIGFSKLTRDLTEKKIAEDSLRISAQQLEDKNNELQRMNQELASFAYVSSHDLQEPLRKIRTFMDRIAESDGDKLSEKGKDYFKRVQNAAARMQTLIQDLLSYSRTNTEERVFTTINLNTIVNDVKADLKEKIEEKKAVIESSALPTVKVVQFQFHQLFTNIIDNSLKFSKPDVPVRITIKADIIKGSSIRNTLVDPKKDYHHITISDNGIGFEPEYNNRIFEVFQRLHGKAEYSGTGIGLAVCKKIIENHGGMINAEGKPDEGATFNFYIPVK